MTKFMNLTVISIIVIQLAWLELVLADPGSNRKCNSASFPNPPNGVSTKFELETPTPSGKWGPFADLSTFVSSKMYRISAGVSDNMKWNHWVIDKGFVKVSSLGGRDQSSGILRNTDVSSSKGQNCDTELEFLYSGSKKRPQQLEFTWTAPPPGTASKNCIKFTVVIVLVRGSSHRLSEGRTHMLCEQSRPTPPPSKAAGLQANPSGISPGASGCNRQPNPEPVKPCRMSSTAIYRLVIENRWNHLHHWKDWPSRDGHPPTLTEYMGASHTSDFDLYWFGGITNVAVQDVCTNGSYSQLQRHFYQSSGQILTILLARALPVNDNNSKRSALVVVNASYPLVSFLSRLEPSPDWCTGVSRVDLCDGRCEWPASITLPLYPWDAGVYSGESYLSSSRRLRESLTGSNNRSPMVCPITSTWPRDNPFTVINGNIKNIGSVTFTLLQEMNKDRNRLNCVVSDAPHSRQDDAGSHKALKQSQKQLPCRLSAWSDWSQCSVSCGPGKGQTERNRSVLSPSPHGSQCAMQPFKEVKSCSGSACPETADSRHVLEEGCLTRLWGEWGPCNASCVQGGRRHRYRVYLSGEERQQCERVLGERAHMTQACSQALMRCHPASVCRLGRLSLGRLQRHGARLCGSNTTVTRFYHELTDGSCRQFTYSGCGGGLNRFETKEECESFCSGQAKSVMSQHEQQQQQNELDESSSMTNAQSVCGAPVMWGRRCRDGNDDNYGPQNRWYFDSINRHCYRFSFQGCHGNSNNFLTKQKCEKLCLSVKTTPVSLAGNSLLRTTSCEYSAWSAWTGVCSRKGGCRGTQIRERLLQPVLSSTVCPGRQTEERSCSDKQACAVQPLVFPQQQRRQEQKQQRSSIDQLLPCRYSVWSRWSPCSARCGRGVRERVRNRHRSPRRCTIQFPQFTDRVYCYNDCSRRL